MRVGFIGVGKIGRPMAEQVAAAGFDLTVHDLSRDAAAPLLDAGAAWAESPKDAAARSDIVCTCVPGPAEMELAVLGEDGVASGLRRGAVYVDHTTNSPALVRRVHDELRTRAVDMLDAPVSGGMEGAQTRDLTVLVGGAPEVLERVRPILDAMAKNVVHVGPIGAGCVCKIAHNCASFVRSMALVECLTLGIKAGVAPDVLVDAFSRGALGTNLDLRVRLPATLFSGDFEPRFTPNHGLQGHHAGDRARRGGRRARPAGRGVPRRDDRGAATRPRRPRLLHRADAPGGTCRRPGAAGVSGLKSDA